MVPRPSFPLPFIAPFWEVAGIPPPEAGRIFSCPDSHVVFCVWHVYETYKNANEINPLLFQSTESQAGPAVSEREYRELCEARRHWSEARMLCSRGAGREL